LRFTGEYEVAGVTIELRANRTVHVFSPAAAPPRAIAPPAPATWLLIAYIAYAFVGAHPFAETSVNERMEGSVVDRVAVLGMCALSMFVVWGHRRAALGILRGNLGFAAVMALCLASVAWSDYPDLTLRRGLLFFFLSLTALAIAAGVPDIRRLHTILFASLSFVILLNLIAVVATPSIAMTDIGARGLYTQKNVAGYVAMLTLVCGATWVCGAERGRGRFFGALALAPTFALLILSRSKTSIGLAALALLVGAMFVIADKLGRRFALLVIAAALLVLTVALGLFAASGFDIGGALDATIGDSSFSGRDELWSFALRNVRERPWLGHGYGAFWDVGAVNDPLAKLGPGTWLGDVEVGTINQAHNGYLELCLHIGLPATILSTATVLYAAFKAGGRALARTAAKAERAAFAAIAAILWLYLLHNLTEATLFMRGSPFASLAAVALFEVARERRHG